MARKDIALFAALGIVSSSSQSLMLNRFIIEISLLARNRVHEYYLLLIARNLGNEHVVWG
jgi:hypothetical protein